jgi:hypothetical protein
LKNFFEFLREKSFSSSGLPKKYLWTNFPKCNPENLPGLTLGFETQFFTAKKRNPKDKIGKKCR